MFFIKKIEKNFFYFHLLFSLFFRFLFFFYCFVYFFLGHHSGVVQIQLKKQKYKTQNVFEIDIYIPSNIVPLNNETLFQHLMLLHLQRPLNSCFFLCFICKSLPHSHILGLVEISPNTHARVKLSSSVFFRPKFFLQFHL